MENTQPKPRNTGAYVGGALLIAIGGVVLLGNLVGSSFIYESIPLGIGIAFLIAYILTRQYGFLVPAGVLSGVGAGVLMTSAVNSSGGGQYVVIMIGLGFLMIYAVDVLVSGSATRWWPLIPGGVLLVVGTTMAGASQAFFTQQLQIWAPAALIVLGILILVTRRREIRH